MRASIITVCFNSSKTIANTVHSVNSQTHHEIEHIFIDGGSSDSTLEIIDKFSTRQQLVLSEPDYGIYDAMNKGFHVSSGEFVAFLNSDDIYADDNVISDVARAFLDETVLFVYGDIEMVNKQGVVARSWRTGQSCQYRLDGMQIPHPAFFTRRSLLQSLDVPFDASYRISADLKQQLILINKMKVTGQYIQRSLVRMAIGGTSTASIRSYIAGWLECIRAYNDIFGSGGIAFTAKKVASKLYGVKLSPLLKTSKNKSLETLD